MLHIFSKYLRCFFFTGILFFSKIVLSQNIDSLVNKIIIEQTTDSMRLVKIEKLMVDEFEIGEFDKSISSAKHGIILAHKTAKFKQKGFFLHYIGKAFDNLSDYNQALIYYQQALLIRENIKDSIGIAKTLANMGNAYMELAEYSKAQDYELRSLKVCENIGAEATLGNVLNSLGQIYQKTEDYNKSLKFFTRSLEVEKRLKNTEGIPPSLGNIAGIYYLLGQKKKNDNYIEKAIQFQINANNLAKELNDKLTLSNGYNLLGDVYKYKGDYEKAFSYYLEGKNICEQEDDKLGILVAQLSIAHLYTLTKKLNEAEKITKQAVTLAIELQTPEYEISAYSILSEIYDKQNRIGEAYNVYKKFISLRDSINSESNQKQMVTHEMNFTFEKKESLMKAEEEKRSALASLESKRQKLIILSVSIGLIFVLVLAVIVYRNLRNNKKKNKIIEQQKEVVERKNKEITDSINYAERIQRSFIATKEILDENLPDYFVLFQPKDVVSGDFYWASKLNNGKFAFVTADSTGHGVPGAIMSLLNITSLEKAIETLTEPSEILNATRKTIIDRLKKDGSADGGKDGMDASLTVYDFKNKKLIIAAANSPVWIMRGSEIIDFKADKMPVGKHDRDTISFNQQEIYLQTGDVVYTLTDGFPDQFGGEKGKKFMSKNLRELLAANSNLSMYKQKQLLEKTFADWIGNLEQVDDVCVIGIRI